MVPAIGAKIIIGIVPAINKAETAAGPKSFSRKTKVKSVISEPNRLKPLPRAIRWILVHKVFVGEITKQF
jgi:hypothetical protein